MKNYWRYFEQMLLALLFGIPVGCVAGAILLFSAFSFFDSSVTDSLADLPAKLAITSLVAILVCLPFGLLFGAPTGAFLFRKGWANPWTAAAMGVCPGLLVWFVSAESEGTAFSTILTAPFGVSVALSTYWFAKRRICH